MKASDTYRHPDYMHNCSQALAYKYRVLFGASEESVMQRFATSGGGRAEGGMCGALYAALAIMPDKKDEIIEAFKSRTGGYTTCMDLKRIGKVPCKECIDAADDIIAGLQGKG